MAIKRNHDSEPLYYFCTFYCYQWLPLIEQTNSYDAVYKRFDYLRKKRIEEVAYVIMPKTTCMYCSIFLQPVMR